MPKIILSDGRQLAYDEHGDPNGVVVFAFSPGEAATSTALRGQPTTLHPWPTQP